MWMRRKFPEMRTVRFLTATCTWGIGARGWPLWTASTWVGTGPTKGLQTPCAHSVPQLTYKLCSAVSLVADWTSLGGCMHAAFYLYLPFVVQQARRSLEWVLLGRFLERSRWMWGELFAVQVCAGANIEGGSQWDRSLGGGKGTDRACWWAPKTHSNPTDYLSMAHPR